MTWTTGFGSDFVPSYPINTIGDFCECNYETMCKVEYGTSLSSSCTCSGTIIIGISESPATNLFQLVPNPTDRKIAIQISP